jgi:hypothetical protein
VQLSRKDLILGRAKNNPVITLIRGNISKALGACLLLGVSIWF